MASANEIKRGTAVSHNGKLADGQRYRCPDAAIRGASTRYKMRFTDVRTGQKVEEQF